MIQCVGFSINQSGNIVTLHYRRWKIGVIGRNCINFALYTICGPHVLLLSHLWIVFDRYIRGFATAFPLHTRACVGGPRLWRVGMRIKVTILERKEDMEPRVNMLIYI